MYGPVVRLVREASRDYMIPGTKLMIPQGTTVFIPIFSIHNDPDYYPEPDKFIPERFSDENKRNLHPMAHLPFGKLIADFHFMNLNPQFKNRRRK